MRKNQDLHSNYFPYFRSSYATPMLNKGPEVLNMKILLFSFNYLQLLNIYTSTGPMVVSREPQRWAKLNHSFQGLVYVREKHNFSARDFKVIQGNNPFQLVQSGKASWETSRDQLQYWEGKSIRNSVQVITDHGTYKVGFRNSAKFNKEWVGRRNRKASGLKGENNVIYMYLYMWHFNIYINSLIHSLNICRVVAMSQTLRISW